MLIICMPSYEPEARASVALEALFKHTKEQFMLVMPCRQKGLAAAWNEGVNLAIAQGCDLVIMGDDDVVKHEEWLTDYRAEVEAGAGLVGTHTVSEKEWGFHVVGFHVVYLPLSTISKVGLFDEVFYPCYFEDNDYCARVEKAGLKLAAVPSPRIDMGANTTCDKVGRERFDVNYQAFKEKWGKK